LRQYNPYSDKATKRDITTTKPTISNYLTQLTSKPIRLLNISLAPGFQKKINQL